MRCLWLALFLAACSSAPVPTGGPDAAIADGAGPDAPHEDGGVTGSDAAVEPTCETPTVYFADADGDGVGALAASISACAKPDGYVVAYGDCDDGDARAFPGQTAYFATPRKGGSFDFDCDGASTPATTKVGNCDFIGSTCVGAGTTNFWSGPVAPGCGEERSWVLECLAGCGQQNELRKQACR